MMIGKKIEWSIIESQYPDKWVILDDVTWNQGLVASAVVVAVCSDDNWEQVYIDYLKQGKDYAHIRTSEVDDGVNLVI